VRLPATLVLVRVSTATPDPTVVPPLTLAALYPALAPTALGLVPTQRARRFAVVLEVPLASTLLAEVLKATPSHRVALVDSPAAPRAVRASPTATGPDKLHLASKFAMLSDRPPEPTDSELPLLAQALGTAAKVPTLDLRSTVLAAPTVTGMATLPIASAHVPRSAVVPVTMVSALVPKTTNVLSRATAATLAVLRPVRAKATATGLAATLAAPSPQA